MKLLLSLVVTTLVAATVAHAETQVNCYQILPPLGEHQVACLEKPSQTPGFGGVERYNLLLGTIAEGQLVLKERLQGSINLNLIPDSANELPQIKFFHPRGLTSMKADPRVAATMRFSPKQDQLLGPGGEAHALRPLGKGAAAAAAPQVRDGSN